MHWILWDSDGVLVETERVFLEANQRALKERGIQLAHDEYREINLIRGESIISHYLGAGVASKQVESRRDVIYRELIGSRNFIIQERAELVKELAPISKMGLVTGSSRACVDKLYQGSGLLELFQFLITEESVSASKPDPAPYKMAREQYKVRPESTIVIEDTIRGWASATTAGFKCILLAPELSRETLPRNIQDSLLSNIAELRVLLSTHALAAQ